MSVVWCPSGPPEHRGNPANGAMRMLESWGNTEHHYVVCCCRRSWACAPKTRVCVVCGQEFVPHKRLANRQKLCSAECRRQWNIDYHERRRARLKQERAL